jgi:hypothetical protein
MDTVNEMGTGEPAPEGVGGVELASELLAEQRRLLVARLVRLPDGHAVELGCWSVTDKGLVEPLLPVVLGVASTAEVRRLVETAISVLPLAEYDADGVALLAQRVDVDVDEQDGMGEMGCTATRAADGGRLFSLWWADAAGIVTVPLGKAAALVRVLAAAERQLAELGLSSPDSGGSAPPPAPAP